MEQTEAASAKWPGNVSHEMERKFRISPRRPKTGNIESGLKSFVKITAAVKYLLKTVNLVPDKFDVENGAKIRRVHADGEKFD